MAHPPAFQPHGPTDQSHLHGEPFTPAEIEHFQAEDRHAARAIIVLMTSVFTLGFLGSLAISIIVAG